MLKIAEYKYEPGEDGNIIYKREINLEELENFGFKYQYRNGDAYIKTLSGRCFIEILGDNHKSSDRAISVIHLDKDRDYFGFQEYEKTMFNLTIDGLVEEVSSENG